MKSLSTTMHTIKSSVYNNYRSDLGRVALAKSEQQLKDKVNETTTNTALVLVSKQNADSGGSK